LQALNALEQARKRNRGTPQKGIRNLSPSSLDDPSLFEPQQSVWTSQRQPWDLFDETLPAN
jgi:hypothetical protein